MMGFAGVEVAAHGQDPGAQRGMDGVATGQRARLLDQQGQQNGKKAHGPESY
jgi:hypothetical protein